MIELDTFYKEVMQNFRDTNNKIDDVKSCVADVVKAQALLENNYKTHVETEVKDKVTKSEKKYKYISVIFGIVAGLTTVYNTLFKN